VNFHPLIIHLWIDFDSYFKLFVDWLLSEF